MRGAWAYRAPYARTFLRELDKQSLSNANCAKECLARIFRDRGFDASGDERDETVYPLWQFNVEFQQRYGWLELPR